MKAYNCWFLLGLFITPGLAFARSEGVPSYYQSGLVQGNTAYDANRSGYNRYSRIGYTNYIGSSGNKEIVNTRSYSYNVPVQNVNLSNGAMTANGISGTTEGATKIYGGYSRRFADFEFMTDVNSILEWDDMIFNEFRIGLRHDFTLRNFDMFAYAEYARGTMESGGLSMDYDLDPYDYTYPEYGIFTVSIGDQSGKTDHLKLALGAHHIWDVAGWKISPSIGYEIFKHDLEMENHKYPNPGIYLPLMTTSGEYVFGDEQGYYYAVPVGYAGSVSEDWYQVCMSPEDIKLVNNSLGATGSYYSSLGNSLSTTDYNSTLGTIPWGVDQGECVIIGGDGTVIVDGTTHIYNTTWSGFFVGLEIEKQMTLADKLRFYVQLGMPKYSAEGTWPNRTDWQQNPSFIDEGSNGSYSYSAEMEYNYKLSDRLQLSIKADTDYFHVGQIPGELYVAEYSYYVTDEYGQYVLDDNGYPILETVSAHTEDVSKSLKHATWRSFGLNLGVKYSF